MPIINYGAECTFGAEFMRHKRNAAAEARAAAKVRAAARVRERAAAVARAQAAVAERAAQETAARDVVPWLRALGFRADEARRAAAHSEDMPNASLEERVRFALSFVPVRGARVVRAGKGFETAAPLAGAGAVVGAGP